LTGLACAAVAALLAAVGGALGWLSKMGVAAAALVGAAVFCWGGPPGIATLTLFFVSGSLLTRWNAARGIRTDPARGHRRTAAQVLANGGWAAVGAFLAARDATLGQVVLIGALATAQADTWATEIGSHSGHPPRSISSWQRVPTGTSGAISGLGTLSGVLGAALIALIAWVSGAPRQAAAAGLAGGVLGLLADSLLGATLQAQYRCARCGADVEGAVHTCGGTGELRRGWTWMTNDLVNVCATGIGAGTAALLQLAMGGLPSATMLRATPG